MKEELQVVEVKKEEKKKKLKKVTDFIKKVWKSIDKKRFIFITIFFLELYFVSEFFNGNEVMFTKIFGFKANWDERWQCAKNAAFDFFKFPKFWANYFLFICIYWIIYGITNRTKFSCALISIILYVFSVINYVVTDIRGISVTISDIYSIKTAMNVAGGMKPNINQNFIAGTIIFIGLMFVLWKIKIVEKKEKRTTRAKLFGIVLGVFGILAIAVPNKLTDTVELWNINRAYANSGAGLTIVRMAKDLKVSKPKEYTPEKVKEILSEYEDDVTDEIDTSKFPNVLVVMDESFADLAKCFDLDLSEDPIEFVHSLEGQENVITGIMHSSQYGGGTANIEWEFLTQNVTAFLPSGSMPYQQYITSEVDESIVNYMNRLGYTTYGMHSWDKSGYSREKVYNKFLKFDHAKFFDTMENLDYGYREYPTDISFFEEYYDIMRNKEKGEKNFTFLITMENHTPYNRTNPDGIDYIDNYDINNYLQLEYGADKGLKLLLDFVKNYDEDTIVLVFGDHQPNVGQTNYAKTGNYSDEESSQVVPFFIYANYDIEEKSGIETSPNYLQSLLLDVIGMPKTPYTKYVEELREDVPIITNGYYKDKDGNSYKINDKESPYYDKLQEYWNVIYYNMFEK